MVKIGSKISLIPTLWVFLFMSSCTFWVMPQDFSKWKTLLRYISVASFICIAFVVVILKIFKFFLIDSTSMKWPLLGFLGPFSPKYCSILLKFWPKVVSNKAKRVFEKSFKILNFSVNRRHPKFTVLFHFGGQCSAGKPKILLKTKIVAKTASLGISNSISPRSKKNHRIAKLNKKNCFFGGGWGQIGCKLPTVAEPKGYQKFSHRHSL